MKIEITLVEHEGQLWFQLADVKFDTLEAIWELHYRTLEVWRVGEVIAAARISDARGDVVFRSYHEDSQIQLNGSALHAEDFKVGDRVVLDVPDGFDLLNDLRKSAWFLQGMIASVPIGKEMPADEMMSRVIPELIRTADAAHGAQVLRFRRSK